LSQNEKTKKETGSKEKKLSPGKNLIILSILLVGRASFFYWPKITQIFNYYFLKKSL